MMEMYWITKTIVDEILVTNVFPTWLDKETS